MQLSECFPFIWWVVQTGRVPSRAISASSGKTPPKEELKKRLEKYGSRWEEKGMREP